MGVLALLIVCGVALTTGGGVLLLGLTTGRRQADVVSEWWIPLFFKASGVAIVGAIAGFVTFEYFDWHVRDVEYERIVRQGIVVREDRQPDRTVYDLDAVRSGGFSRLVRYDFRILWEVMAGVAAIAAIIGGLLAVAVAHVTIRARRRQVGFTVLGPDE